MTRVALRRAVAVWATGPPLLFAAWVVWSVGPDYTAQPMGAVELVTGLIVLALASSSLGVLWWGISFPAGLAMLIGTVVLISVDPWLPLLSLVASVLLAWALVDGLVPAEGRQAAPSEPAAVALASFGVMGLVVAIGRGGAGGWDAPSIEGLGLWVRAALLGGGAVGVLGLMSVIERLDAHRVALARAALVVALAVAGLAVGVVSVRERDVADGVVVVWWWSLPMTSLVLLLLIRAEVGARR